ncbi:MAG: serine/threonine-protein kinase [Sandaracinaceae bacterium]
MPRQVGPFRIERRLGRGGMAETFVGVREGPGQFHQTVCLKRILEGDHADPEMIRLFRREARVVASLAHRAITRVIDFGHDDRGYWLALELVEGTDLRALMKRRPSPRALPPEVAVYIAMEIAEALAHAHEHSPGPVVHRDVSPANVLLGHDGSVKLTDFGLAKNVAELGPQTKLTRGNLRYMAPEVLNGRARQDPRSDLFALGVILYQCLSGARPYHSNNLAEAVSALMRGDLIPLVHSAPHLRSGLLEVVHMLMAPRIERRFQSARAVVRALGDQGDLLAGRNGLMEEVRWARERDAAPPPPEEQTESLSISTQDSPHPHLEHAMPPRWAKYEEAPRVWQTVDLDQLKSK